VSSVLSELANEMDKAVRKNESGEIPTSNLRVMHKLFLRNGEAKMSKVLQEEA
jgi:hypothetical protein